MKKPLRVGASGSFPIKCSAPNQHAPHLTTDITIARRPGLSLRPGWALSCWLPLWDGLGPSANDTSGQNQSELRGSRIGDQQPAIH